MKSNLLFPIILLAFGILASCGVDDSENPDAESTFGIRHDRELSDYEEKAAEASSDLPDFSSVVCFQYNLTGGTELDYVATGTVIDEYWILTAGHNFFTSEDQTSPAPASGIFIAIGNDPNDPDTQYEVEELVFHPTWLTADDGYANGNDMCLVKTKEPIIGITPQTLYTGSDEPIGDKVWYCGFGDYSQIEGQNPDLYSKKHAHENILDRVVGGIESSINGTTYTGGVLAYDFDDPDGLVNSLGDDHEGEDEKSLGSGTSEEGALDLEAGTVQGDSGGPLFIKDGNTWKVAGVLSGGAVDPLPNHKDGDYGDISLFTRVAPLVSWINSVIQ